MDQLYFIRHKDNEINLLTHLFFPYLNQYDTWNIFDFRDPQIGSYRCKNFNTITDLVYDYRVIILDIEFKPKRITVDSDIQNKDDPRNPLWSYDGIAMSTVHNSREVEILFLPVTTSSWCEPDLYVIPYYKDEMQDQSYWQFLMTKTEIFK